MINIYRPVKFEGLTGFTTDRLSRELKMILCESTCSLLALVLVSSSAVGPSATRFAVHCFQYQKPCLFPTREIHSCRQSQIFLERIIHFHLKTKGPPCTQIHKMVTRAEQMHEFSTQLIKDEVNALHDHELYSWFFFQSQGQKSGCQSQ